MFVVDSKNVMVPVRLEPPERVAVSDAEPPATIVFAERVVRRAGAVEPTTKGSQALVAPLFVPSPL